MRIASVCRIRYWSVFGFFVYLIAGLIAYTFHEKRPSLNLGEKTSLSALVF